MDEDSYEAFIARARREARRDEEVRKRGVNGRGKRQHWPGDPWRGGFGPNVNGGKKDVYGVGGSGYSRVGGREVGDWLRGCGI